MTHTEQCASCGAMTQPDPLNGEPFCDACFEDMSIGDCLKRLGITPDQLRIARALDREKVEAIAAQLYHADRSYGPFDVDVLLSWLPTFPPKEDKP